MEASIIFFRYEVTAFRGIRMMAPFHRFDPENNIGALAECSHMQSAQEPGYSVALVACQAEPVAKFVDRDPSFICGILHHILLKQFRNAVIFSHRFILWEINQKFS
jgi:hypothetical protein